MVRRAVQDLAAGALEVSLVEEASLPVNEMAAALARFDRSQLQPVVSRVARKVAAKDVHDPPLALVPDLVKTRREENEAMSSI